MVVDELFVRKRMVGEYLKRMGTSIEILSTQKIPDGAGGWTRGDPVSRGTFLLRVIDPTAANAPGTLLDAPEGFLVGKKQRRRGFDLMLVGNVDVPMQTDDIFVFGGTTYRIEHVYHGRDRVVAGATVK
jgi:hypothetical protein